MGRSGGATAAPAPSTTGAGVEIAHGTWSRAGVGRDVGSLRTEWHVGTRRQLRHQGFDLLTALTAGLCEDGPMVLRSEVSAQQPHRCEGHVSRSEEIEDHREAPAGPSGLDAIASGIFRKPQRVGAIAEQGSMAQGGVDGGPCIERSQMGHELGDRRALLTCERLEAREQVPVREGGRGGEDADVHALCVSRRVSRSGPNPYGVMSAMWSFPVSSLRSPRG